MEYAIVSTGGKQYKVGLGEVLDVEYIAGEEGSKIEVPSVLAVRKGDEFRIGSPNVDGATVTAKIVEHPLGPKVVNFRFERRKGYHRKVGHRQKLTRLEILEIKLNGA